MENSNIQISLSAKNYSQALVEIARDNVLSFEDIDKDLNTISEILDMSEELKNAFENPTISDKTKSEIADEVFQKEIHPQILNFIKILIDKKRFQEFDQIKADYLQELDKINNIQTVDIISAIEINNDFKSEIIKKLQEKLNKNIRPNWLVDETIIAGLVFKINDDIIDTSIKTKLDKLSKNLM